MHIYDSKLTAKIGRAFRKSGIQPTKEQASAFLDELLTIGVPVLHRSSSRIARVIRGEKPVQSLLKEVVKKRKADHA